MLCLTLTVSAASYDIKVCGVQVTDANKSDVLGDGKVAYVPSGQQLVFKDGTNLSYSGTLVTANQDMGIIVDGKVTLTSTTVAPCIIFNGSNKYRITFFTGTLVRQLTLKSSGGGISINGTSTLDINAIDLKITTGKWEPIYGTTGSANKPTVKFIGTNATLTPASGYAPIVDVSSVSFEACAISSPTGLTFSSGDNAFVSGGSVYKGAMQIAPDDYKITIGDVKVTGANYKNIDGKGKIFYSPSNNLLSLDNATVNGAISFQGNKAITLRLTGANKINATKNGIYISNKPLTIIGTTDDASLDISQTDTQYKAINLYNAGTLTIKNCEVTATGAAMAIGGTGSNPTINVENAKVVASITGTPSTSQGAFVNISGINYKDCYAESAAPKEMVYVPSLKGICGSSESTLADKVIINKGTGYNVWYAARRVSSNYLNLSGDGHVQYNAANNRIMFVDASVHHTTSDPLIFAGEGQKLEILVSGTNSVTTSNYGIVHYGDLRIYSAGSGVGGSGTLTITSGGGYCINSLSDVLLENVTVNAKAKTSAFNDYDKTHKLTIKNSKVTLTGGTNAVSNYASVVLDGVDVIDPTNVEWSKGLRTFTHAGVVCKDLKIGYAEYELSIGGTKVTTANYKDIYGDGKMSFDPATYTLTLNNALIANVGYCINAGYVSGTTLTIKLIGKSTLQSQKSDAMYLDIPTIITSDSNGELEASAPSSIGIYHNSKLSYKDCTVSASGYAYGIMADHYSGGYSLNIDNATVKAHGSKAAFYNYKYSSLTNCYVADPHPCKFDGSVETLSGFTRYNKMCTDVEIVPGLEPTWYDLQVKGKYVNSKNAADILGNGLLSWNDTEKTLTMNNLDLTYDGTAIILDVPATIKLIGDNKITSTSNGITARKEYLNIESDGTGKLTMRASGTAPCIYIVGVVGNVKNCELDFEGGSAIVGYNHGMYPITFDNVKAHLVGNTNGALYNYTDVTLTDCQFADGAEFDAAQNAVIKDGVVAKDVTIYIPHGPYLPADADITVVSKTENSVKFKWDAATDDVTPANELRYQVRWAVQGESQQVVATLTGETEYEMTGLEASTDYIASVVVLNNDDDIAMYNPLYVTTDAPNTPVLPADATLKVVGKTETTVKIQWDAATDMVTLPENLRYYMYCGLGQTINPLFVEYITGETEYEFTGLEADTEYTFGVVAENENGGMVTYDLLYATTDAYVNYDIKVKGINVTSGNYADVLGDGTVAYDPSVNTLYLGGADIDAGSSEGIHVDTSTGITIMLIGENSIKSDNCPLYIDAPKVTIKGYDETAKLDIQSNTSYPGIFFSAVNTVNLNDVNANIVTNGGIGLSCSGASTNATLTNCNIDIKTGNNAVKGFHSMVFSNCYIETPKNAIYNPLKGSIVDKDDMSVVYGDVTIKAGIEEGIESITVDADDAKRHNVQGVQVGNGFKGIVIKNGRKYVQK